LPAPIEVAAYYVVTEMLTNAAKHAQATAIQIRAHLDVEQLHVSIRDDGIGGDNPAGSGITGLRDRVEALGGTFKITSDPGRETVGICQLPTTVPTRPSWWTYCRRSPVKLKPVRRAPKTVTWPLSGSRGRSHFAA
jgi:signal transduction histidine kinase